VVGRENDYKPLCIGIIGHGNIAAVNIHQPEIRRYIAYFQSLGKNEKLNV